MLPVPRCLLITVEIGEVVLKTLLVEVVLDKMVSAVLSYEVLTDIYNVAIFAVVFRKYVQALDPLGVDVHEWCGEDYLTKSSSCPLPFPSNNATVITHAERERDSKLSTKTKTKTKTHLDRFVSDLFPCRRQLLPSSHFWRVGYIDEAFFLCVRIIFKVWVLSYNQRWQHNQQELVQITITSSSFFLMATMSYKQALADQLNLKHRQVEV